MFIASPDTIALLQGMGWGNIPRISSAQQSRRNSLNKPVLPTIDESCVNLEF
jgi:hypothetical protein